jgi:hypothetical protein
VIDENMKMSSRWYRLYAIVAGCVYVGTLVIYLIVVMAREPEQIKFIGISTPIFVIFSDVVILSLREMPLSVDGKSSQKELEITDIVYSTTF